MQNFDLGEMAEVIKPYLGIIKQVQQKSFSATIAVKDLFAQAGTPVTLKPRAKGSLISDCVKTYLQEALYGDVNARIIEVDGVVGLLINEKVFIRFNKMDEHFQTSIQKRKGYKRFINQGEELPGLPSSVIRLWASFTPIDKEWSDVARYFLVCFDAGRVIWFNNLEDYTVEQLSINLQPVKKRRTRIKNQGDIGETNTGTNNL